MTYHILYNPTLNNALVGLTDTPPVVPDGFAVKARPGDMPDMSKMAYNPAVLDFYLRNDNRRFTKLEYLRLFTTAERVSIRVAAKSTPVLEDYMALLELASEISLDDPDTIAALQMLEAVGLLAPGRAAEILG